MPRRRAKNALHSHRITGSAPPVGDPLQINGDRFSYTTGTDALVTVSLGIHGVHLATDFGYIWIYWIYRVKMVEGGETVDNREAPVNMRA